MAEKAGKRISDARAWSYVILGGLLEIVWASGFKYEAVPGLVVLIALLASFDLIIRARHGAAGWHGIRRVRRDGNARDDAG